MQIRSQYLIQDNHNDYTSEPPFSRACICLLSCTHVCIPSPDTYSPPFCGTHAYPFHPSSSSSSVPSRASARSCTVGSWKCLGAPRRSAGSRGKNATLLIIKYARDGAQERGAGGRRTVCTLYTNVQCGLEVLAERLTMVAMKRFQREGL